MKKKIIYFLKEEIWRYSIRETDPPLKRIGLLTLKTILLVIRGFVSKQLNVSANSLTYSLVFAIIPILAMILAVARGFGFADIIYDSLNHSFLSETNMVPTLMGMVDRYLQTAQGGVFIGVGVIILLWSVYSFFSSVETLFNRIWNVQQSRSVLYQSVTYIAVLFLIPILIVISSGISILINAASQEITILSSYKSSFIRLFQFVFVWVVFAMLYKMVPNTRVKFLSAIIPGILMGTLYQLIQMLSVYVLMFLSRTSIVYGAFATIPILLTWLQWTCLLILIGAQMSYAIQNNEQFTYEKELQTMSRRYNDALTLFVLSIFIHRFENSEPPCSPHYIAQTFNLPIRLVNQIVASLVEIGFLNEIFSEIEHEDTLFQPAMDTHKITMEMAMHKIENRGNCDFIIQAHPKVLSFTKKINDILDAQTNTGKILISEI